MEITRIRVSGFKSFSDPVELAIEGGLTGVVGPNGCGKSNIVEALRWAMGESSAKGLRGDEMEDVIFNGTGSRPAHDVAEVRLKLRGRPEGLAGRVDTEDVEVSRKIARGVGSTYRINGKEARARDIQLLFADAGAGSRSPAIVGQGQIGFIVDAKPGNRRKLLEDAAGIGGLQTRRREAELKLEATQANLQRVLDLLGAQDARLAELKKQGRQAERYRKLAADLRRTEMLVLLARHEAAAKSLRDAEALVAELAAEVERRRRAAADVRQARDRAAAELPRWREQATTESARAAALRERLTALRTATEREASHLAALERQQAEAVADLDRAARNSRELKGARVAAEAELASLGERLEELKAAQVEAGPEESTLAHALAEAQARMHAAVAGAAEARAQREAAEARQAQLEARRAALADERSALPALGAAEAALEHARQERARGETALMQARAALTAVEEELAQREAEREAQRVVQLTAERDLAEARQALAVAEQQVREAEAAAMALGERRSALARQVERLAERRRGHAARREAHARGLAEADVDARDRELVAAEEELRRADAELDAARAAVNAADHARSEAAESLRELRRSADAVAAEIGVLESLVQERPEGGLLDRVSVPDDLAIAVAAALGDDLLAGEDPEGPCFWRELPGEPGAALPGGATRLLDAVEAPPALHRRLAQVGICGTEEAALLQPGLAPGQRLVSRDGGLWRWDGFVRAPEAEDGGAARVRHHLRLHAAREEAARLGHAVEAAETALAEAGAALAAARATLSTAEGRWRAADSGQLRARQRCDEARKLAERAAHEAARLAEEERGLDQEDLEQAGEQEKLDQQAVTLPDLAGLRTAVGERSAALAAAEQARRAADAQAQRLARLQESAANALRTRRAAVEAGQAFLERAMGEVERATRVAAELQAHHTARTAALASEEEQLSAACAAAAAELEAAQMACARRQAERRAAEAALATAAQASREATERLAGLRAESASAEQRGATLRTTLADLAARLAEAEAAASELHARVQRLTEELVLEKAARRGDPDELDRLAREGDAAEAAAAAAREEQTRREAELTRLDRELEAAETVAVEMRERLAVAQAERSHAATALGEALAAVEDRLQQRPEALLADEETRAAVDAASVLELEAEQARLRAARDRLGPVNLCAEVEVAELEAEINEAKAREAELQAAIARLRAAIGTLDKEGRERLLAAFTAVDAHFQKLFQQLFGGGKAQLRLVGADDPLHAGLELEASPPGKKLASISLLSGGEKTLTALALVFGFFLAQPSPLCVLDEVDAPLDDANVDRFVNLMQEIAAATGTRFLVVTHHPLTMARMDRLYGVTMAERGVSRLVSVALEEALELRATA